WTERKDKSVRIEQTIFVERESQRKIVLGKAGATIKSIGADARKEIAELIEQPVHLFLFVKVRENSPRWVLTALLVLSVFSLLPVLAENGLELDSGIEVVSCVLTAVGLYC